MPIGAGDLLSISVEHSELGDRTFEVKSGEDYTYMTGGFKSNDDDGNIGTFGTRIDQKNRFPWAVEVTCLLHDGDHDYLQSIAESAIEGSWLFEHISGEIRVGSGTVAGDVSSNRQAGTIGFKCQGSGRLELIS